MKKLLNKIKDNEYIFKTIDFIFTIACAIIGLYMSYATIYIWSIFIIIRTTLCFIYYLVDSWIK